MLLNLWKFKNKLGNLISKVQAAWRHLSTIWDELSKFLKHGPQTPGDLPERIWGQNYFHTYTESFCCTTETNIMLNMSYTPQLKKKFHNGLPLCSDSKEFACNTWDPGSIPSSGRSPGEVNGYLLQYSCLKNPWPEEPGGL